MTDCKPCSTPVDICAKISADDGPPVDDPTHYRGLASALQYLTFTRLDIAMMFSRYVFTCMILVSLITPW